jgi:tRNA 2-thiouridine synthesizing protein E
MALEVNGVALETYDEGFLLDPCDWNLDVARVLAQSEALEMGDAHWSVVTFVRDHYERYQSVPEARHALKDMQRKLGRDKASRKFLYSLFPYGYGQQACKIAGMRKPLKLMLDI